METNIMVYLTEEVVRKIVRQELQEVLIEEGIMQDIGDWAGRTIGGKFFKNTLGIAMLLAAMKPTEIAEAEMRGGLNTDSAQVQNIFQELGIKNFNALANDPFTPEEKQQLQAGYDRIRPIQATLQKIRDAKQTLEQQYQETDDEQQEAEIKAKYLKAKEMEEQVNRQLSREIDSLKPLSEKILQQGDLTGIIIQDAVDNDGDLSQVDTQRVALEMVQKFASGDQEVQSKILGSINDTVNDDLTKFANSVTRSAGMTNVPLSSQAAFEIAAAYAELNEFDLPANPTTIDVVKALDANKDQLLGKYSDFQTTKKYNLDGQLIVQLNVAMKGNPDGYLDREELATAMDQTMDRYQAGLYRAEEVPADQAPSATGTGTQVTVKEMILRSNKFRGRYV